jgi:hypothetical protein
MGCDAAASVASSSAAAPLGRPSSSSSYEPHGIRSHGAQGLSAGALGDAPPSRALRGVGAIASEKCSTSSSLRGNAAPSFARPSAARRSARTRGLRATESISGARHRL